MLYGVTCCLDSAGDVADQLDADLLVVSTEAVHAKECGR